MCAANGRLDFAILAILEQTYAISIFTKHFVFPMVEEVLELVPLECTYPLLPLLILGNLILLHISQPILSKIRFSILHLRVSNLRPLHLLALPVSFSSLMPTSK
jgi:hypothetical protein